MKLLNLLIVFFLFSCNVKQKKQNNTEEISKVLMENKSEISLYSKSRLSNDLVEEMYEELTKNDSILSSIQNNINDIRNNKSDSLKDYHTFLNKNEQYFSSAKNMIEAIKDSLLKKRMHQLIFGNELELSNKTNYLKTLESKIEQKEIYLRDVHLGLKITSTLEMLEKYQKNNFPPGSPLEAILKKYSTTIDQIEKKTADY